MTKAALAGNLVNMPEPAQFWQEGYLPALPLSRLLQVYLAHLCFLCSFEDAKINQAGKGKNLFVIARLYK